MTEPISGLPDRCGVALKEWAAVVMALLSGRQTVLIRKGGIEEGPGGFQPEHPVFWLYPTRFHEHAQGLRIDPSTPGLQAPPPGQIEFPGLAWITGWSYVEEPDRLEWIEDEHVWSPETVEQRFQYKKPGLWVLRLRVYRSFLPPTVPDKPEYAGCKSWVVLDQAIETRALEPVLADDEAGRRAEAVARLLGDVGTVVEASFRNGARA